MDIERFDEKDFRRAAILEMNLDGSDMKVFASGLRNPVGLAFEPNTDVLFTTVNERDMLGDDLVPDFLTSVRRGAFYGWPYAYFGTHPDPRKVGERDDLVARSIAPDLALGSHTASLGLAFYTAKQFPAAYHGGVFIGQHGSSNRSQFSGYKVIYAPFYEGRRAGDTRNDAGCDSAP